MALTMHVLDSHNVMLLHFETEHLKKAKLGNPRPRYSDFKIENLGVFHGFYVR